ncbi:MAG: response regulator [Acidobacteriota bacterium]|nr:response regulator [Acidobacteriota bacterium]
MENKLRIVIADDERPARMFLRAMIETFDDTEIVGEAENGAEAVEIIEQTKPDLALLDLQMPVATGLEAVRLIKKKLMPLVAFVTAYDDYAVQAFEVNAVDYLLKPVDRSRLRATLDRARERLEQQDFRERETSKIKAATETYEEIAPPSPLERIPVKYHDAIVLVPVAEIVAVVADAELLHITTDGGVRYTINFRLKDLEARLDAAQFIRLSRGTLINLRMISHVNPLPGGTYSVVLKNNQELSVSRLQSKIFRRQFLQM